MGKDTSVRATALKLTRRTVLLVRIVTIAILFLAVFSFLHPVGESFSVIQFPLAGFALFLCAFRHNWVLRLPMLVVAILALGQVGLAFRNPNGAGNVTVYQKNLLYLNDGTPRVLRDVLAVDPEVVTAQEMTVELLDQWKAHLTDYPTVQYCANKLDYGTAVFSKWPAVANSGFCMPNGKLAGVQLRGPDGPVWVLSLRLYWPWPYEQTWQIPEIIEVLQRLNGPVIIGGDFNNLPWSGAVNILAEAARGERAGGVEPTFYLSGIPLSIDHVIAPGGGVIEPRPKFSSDHIGIVARVGLTPRP